MDLDSEIFSLPVRDRLDINLRTPVDQIHAKIGASASRPECSAFLAARADLQPLKKPSDISSDPVNNTIADDRAGCCEDTNNIISNANVYR